MKTIIYLFIVSVLFIIIFIISSAANYRTLSDDKYNIKQEDLSYNLSDSQAIYSDDSFNEDKFTYFNFHKSWIAIITNLENKIIPILNQLDSESNNYKRIVESESDLEIFIAKEDVYRNCKSYFASITKEKDIVEFGILEIDFKDQRSPYFIFVNGFGGGCSAEINLDKQIKLRSFNTIRVEEAVILLGKNQFDFSIRGIK